MSPILSLAGGIVIMGYWVYLVRCGDGKLYTGSTTDLARRLKEHNSGAARGKRGARFTAGRRPVNLVQAWEVPSWADALRLEARIKKCNRTEKERLIANPDTATQFGVMATICESLATGSGEPGE